MKKLFIFRRVAIAVAVGLQTAALHSFAEADCEADKAWLHPTSAPDLTMTPKSHGAGGDDCPFYSAAWRTFLFATNSNSAVPQFVSSFATIESTFGKELKFKFPAQKPGKLALLPRVAKRPGHQAINAGVAQAGDLAGILIDRDGYPVYYAIHMNDVYTKFLHDNKLTTAVGAQTAKPELAFPTGAIELKSAWKVIPAGSNLEEKYFTVEAQVPRLKKGGGAQPDVVIDMKAPPVDVKVALVALHVVFVLGNHSEFIWSTFEHTDDAGNPDSAPLGPIPGAKPPATEVPGADLLLFKAHTTIADGNNVSSATERVAQFDEATQRFKGTTARIPSSIYRFYPFSKVIARDEATDKPKPADEADEQVVAINRHMGDLFKEDAANGVIDKRRFYRLVGAVWLDKHEDFLVGKPFQNGSTQTSDEGPVAGEDGLSSTAMESFTQEDNKNCFSCHDTQAIVSHGKIILEPKLINVSHIISKYLIEHP